MKNNLTVLAGKRALEILRDGGLKPEMVHVVAGAAGGPKWLALNGLDRAIFSSWLTGSDHPVFLIGSSIGAWRFAAIAQGMESGAYDRFERAYLDQRYSLNPTAAEVTGGSARVMDAFLDNKGIQAVLSNTRFRLSIMTVRCRGPFSRDERYTLGPSMLLAALANVLSRKLLGLFFSRALFFDPRTLPPFFDLNGFPLQRVPLMQENMSSALLASGSIPLIMEGVKNPAGASPGVYRDGGIIDYHLDIPFGSGGLVLFPHYTDHIVPGWLDKMLMWRKPSPANQENVVVVCPSASFVERLPYGKIPDRDDFISFRSRDVERVAFWKKAIDASRALGDEFLELADGNGMRDVARPLEGR